MAKRATRSPISFPLLDEIAPGLRVRHIGVLAGRATLVGAPFRRASRCRASATPGAGWPYSLAVTRARAARCRQRKAGRVAANSSVTVR